MIVTLQTLIFFRESLLDAVNRFLRPYYHKLSLTFGRNSDFTDEEEPEEQVFSEFDDEKGVVFYPPVYLQRYAAVSDCLLDERWHGKLDKVVDLGYHDMSFIKYLKEVTGIRCILGVDIESIPLRCSTDLVYCDDYGPKRENPLEITLFQGNAADPDYRLIGCDAVIAIEMIEHMLPHDLDRLVHTVFGFIKPWVVIFTTPNADFNVLFKALEKNGLRRWDHFFEWTREQFNDWCSNIVSRYPEYVVSCAGVGPGPPGTLHLGCCSQLAMFTANDYRKQRDLNPDSLALVSEAPRPYSVSDILGAWDESDEPTDRKMLCQNDNVESDYSLTKLMSEAQSGLALMAPNYTDTEALLRQTAISLMSFSQQDKEAQCNLDTEIGKNFLMLDYEQLCFDMVAPRKTQDTRTYVIEDVSSRLNCTTLQVKSFSKTTQNMMSKTKVDTLVHTREVVNEIRHLTKMLNFNKDSQNGNGVYTWHNINWGDDAPYWNKYYKVVKQYNPPYETKSEECRITELISEEINRLIDGQFDDSSPDLHVHRLEIPVGQLMHVVSHITDDVEKVKDLLEWDGYEIVNNVVIHSRIAVDAASRDDDDDWPDNDTGSEWDSEVRSTTWSDGSTVPDHHARCLHRALDRKVRNLRAMLTVDEDITAELNKVVSKLIQMALCTSKRRRAPPPTKWMQWKMLDLLSLTENAIQRRKTHFIQNYPLTSDGYDPSVKSLNIVALEKIKEDDTGSKIVDKYSHLVSESPEALEKYRSIEGNLEDLLSVTSAEFLKRYEYPLRTSENFEPTVNAVAQINTTDKLAKLERTQAWLEDDLQQDLDNDISSGGDTDHSTSHNRYYKHSYKRYKGKSIEFKCVICQKSHPKFDCGSKKDKKTRNKHSKTKIIKKLSRKKSSSNDLSNENCTKFVSVDYRQYRIRSRKRDKTHQPTASKPIPESIIELCNPVLSKNVSGTVSTSDSFKAYELQHFKNDEQLTHSERNDLISETVNSNFIEIISEEKREIIAMNRTIGTGSQGSMSFNETVIKDDMFQAQEADDDTDPSPYQTIFLNDINEPSTSKGIQHISMDVQCGPDVSNDYVLAATTSIRMPSIFTAGIKMGSSLTDTKLENSESYTNKIGTASTYCCTSTSFDESELKIITARSRAVGITINDTPYPDEQAEVPVIVEQDSKTDTQTFDTRKSSRGSVSPILTSHSKNDHIATMIPLPKAPKVKRRSTLEKTDRKQTGSYKTEPASLRVGWNKRKESPNGREALSTIAAVPIRKGSSPPKEINVTRPTTPCLKENHSMKQKASSKVQAESNKQNRNLPNRQPQSPTSKIPKTESPRNQQKSSSENKTSPTIKKYTVVETKVPCNKTKAESEKQLPIDRASVNCIETNAVAEQNLRIVQQLPTMAKINEILNEKEVICTPHSTSSTETKYIKPVASTNKIDSLSDFCCSNASSPTHTLSLANCDMKVKLSLNKDVGVSRKLTRYIRPKLCYGGVQVHSYRNRETSEDVMFQGMWQNLRHKVTAVRKLSNPIKRTKSRDKLLRKSNMFSKENMSNNSFKRGNVQLPNKLPPYRKKYCFDKNQPIQKDYKLSPTRAVKNDKKPFANTVKTSSKVAFGSVSSKCNKSVFIVKKPSKTVIVRKDDKQANKPQTSTKTKQYIPAYLKRRAQKLKSHSRNITPDSSKTVILPSNIKKSNSVRPQAEEIKRDLLKLQVRVPQVNYLVLSNELQKTTNGGSTAKKVENSRRRNAQPKRTSSPQSQNSSTSSPNSIATVRATSITKNASNRRLSNSSYKTTTTNSSSENTTHHRNKKYIKRCKNSEFTDEKQFDNKENFPQSSRQHIGNDKKGTFSSQQKVYVAHVKSPPLYALNKKPKSNVNIMNTESLNEKIPKSPTISPVSSIESNEIIRSRENTIAASTGTSNMVLVLEPHRAQYVPSTSTRNAYRTVSSPLAAEWIKEGNCVIEKENVRTYIKSIVEGALEFLDTSIDSCSSASSRTVILKREDNTNALYEITSSPISFRTIVTNDEDTSFRSGLESALYRSFDTTFEDDSTISLAGNESALTDLDVLSFKSFNSCLKKSSIISAARSPMKLVSNTVSVKGIYERKEQPFAPAPQSNAGAIADQAFSGFSLDVDRIAGDKPDPINLIDSETGSIAEVNRQANSEELFVSGRSTDSFVSCLIDDDTVVPSWLFQIIQQQQQEAAEEMEEDPPEADQDDDMYDVNGNEAHHGGLGAGAGDGRGIHSDQSQDSSGRGTSLSSSVTSSGAQSEAILLDPSAFVAQFEGGSAMLQDSEDSSLVILGITDDAVLLGSHTVGPTPATPAYTRSEPRRAPAEVTASDADVSSLDTDAPDSS